MLKVLIAGIFLLLLVLESDSIQFEDHDIPQVKGFDCDSFQYSVSKKYFFGNDGFPVLTQDDSIALVYYANKIDAFPTQSGTILPISSILYLLPRTRGIINTSVYDSIQFDSKTFYDLRSFFAGKIREDASLVATREDAAKAFMLQLISSDAAVTGEIIDQRLINDSTKCFYFKSEYKLRIKHVFNSHFDLKGGDEVLIVSTHGFSAGCNIEKQNMLDVPVHGNQIVPGQSGLFLLRHSEYYSRFLIHVSKEEVYADKYCPNAFVNSDWNGMYDVSDTNLIYQIGNLFNYN